MVLLYEQLSYRIRGAVFEVYKTLGNGHKEKVYQHALAKELAVRGVAYIQEHRIKVDYKRENVGVYVPDFLIEDKVIVETKAKPALHKDDIDQFWHYLRGTEYRLGFLVNFGAYPKAQIIRRVH